MCLFMNLGRYLLIIFVPNFLVFAVIVAIHKQGINRCLLQEKLCKRDKRRDLTNLNLIDTGHYNNIQ